MKTKSKIPSCIFYYIISKGILVLWALFWLFAIFRFKVTYTDGSKIGLPLYVVYMIGDFVGLHIMKGKEIGDLGIIAFLLFVAVFFLVIAICEFFSFIFMPMFTLTLIDMLRTKWVVTWKNNWCEIMYEYEEAHHKVHKKRETGDEWLADKEARQKEADEKEAAKKVAKEAEEQGNKKHRSKNDYRYDQSQNNTYQDHNYRDYNRYESYQDYQNHNYQEYGNQNGYYQQNNYQNSYQNSGNQNNNYQNNNYQDNSSQQQADPELTKALATFMLDDFNFTESELKSMYHRLIKSFHPDGNSDEDKKYAQKLNHYYEILKPYAKKGN